MKIIFQMKKCARKPHLHRSAAMEKILQFNTVWRINKNQWIIKRWYNLNEMLQNSWHIFDTSVNNDAQYANLKTHKLYFTTVRCNKTISIASLTEVKNLWKFCLFFQASCQWALSLLNYFKGKLIYFWHTGQMISITVID